MNPYLTNEQMLELLRTRIGELGAQYKVADELGITAAHLSDILAGNHVVTDRVAEKLGYRREYCYFPLETVTA